MLKKEEEQWEVLMNKKRLEYIMRQSEAYTSFMAQKLEVKLVQEVWEPEVYKGHKIEIDDEE